MRSPQTWPPEASSLPLAACPVPHWLSPEGQQMCTALETRTHMRLAEQKPETLVSWREWREMKEASRLRKKVPLTVTRLLHA